jgi:uncharacterized protein YeeX (DUF496 family)
MEQTALIEKIPAEAVPAIISIASGFVAALVGFVFGYCASRSMQRREWRKRDAREHEKDIEVLESCITAVKLEIENNHKVLEQKQNDYIARIWEKPLFELSTASFESAWPVFVTKGLVQDKQKELQIVNSLFSGYIHVNLMLQNLRRVLAPMREIPEEVKLALAGLVRESVEKQLEDRALKALDDIQNELAGRRGKIGPKLGGS